MSAVSIFTGDKVRRIKLLEFDFLDSDDKSFPIFPGDKLLSRDVKLPEHFSEIIAAILVLLTHQVCEKYILFESKVEYQDEK